MNTIQDKLIKALLNTFYSTQIDHAQSIKGKGGKVKVQKQR